jgi:hypothetical protein
VEFYFRFIKPSLRKIGRGRGDPIFSRFVSDSKYRVWQGLTFESVCYQHSDLIADKLGFAAVDYECGPWFSRASDSGHGQIDLLFVRRDRVITLCEIKFQDQKIGKGIIPEVEKKRRALPNPKKHTIEMVLISASPPTDDLLRERYFNRVLSIEELFGS